MKTFKEDVLPEISIIFELSDEGEGDKAQRQKAEKIRWNSRGRMI